MKKLFYCYILIILVSACTSTPAATPSPTVTIPAPTGTITPTIVWFPPSATPTRFPTPVITPTADMRPMLGKIIFEDDFSDLKSWSTSQTEEGSVAFGINELTIAIGENNAYLYSLREQPIFTDFYMEITAETTLCRDLDEYGVLFRVSPTIDYYRFALSCNGQVRLDRIKDGQASSPQPWMLSGSVPPGAPSKVVIGVAAIGSELSFFVNGQFQFSLHEPLLTSGGLGVFARATNKMAVTVSFSHLVVYEVIK